MTANGRWDLIRRLKVKFGPSYQEKLIVRPNREKEVERRRQQAYGEYKKNLQSAYDRYYILVTLMPTLYSYNNTVRGFVR